MIAPPPVPMLFFYSIIQFHGALKSNVLLLVPLRKPNIKLLQPPWLNWHGFNPYYRTSMSHSLTNLLFTMIMWEPNIYVSILSFTHGWNTLPLISTLFVTRLLMVTFVSLMFWQKISSLMHSQNLYPGNAFYIFYPRLVSLMGPPSCKGILETIVRLSHLSYEHNPWLIHHHKL